MSGYCRDDINFILDGETTQEQSARKFRLDYECSLRSLGYDDEDIAYILRGGPDKESALRKHELDLAVKYRLLGKNAKEAQRLSAVIAAQMRAVIASAELPQVKRRLHSATIPAFKFGARVYGPLISEESLLRGMDPLLCHAVTQNESGYNAKAVSSKGARGLMQLMPETAATLGVRDAFDPRQNVQGGIRYLAEQLRAFGRIDLALAAYNAGPQAVRKYRGIPPYAETVTYVQKVMKSYADLKAANGMIAVR
jgi:soluble lytic murein transglycosylase-like protein